MSKNLPVVKHNSDLMLKTLQKKQGVKRSARYISFVAFFMATTYLTPSLAVDVATPTELINAINAANASPTPTVINITSDISLLASGTNMGLPAITGSVTINGNGKSITGNNQRIFVIGQDGAGRNAVTINDLNLTGAQARGGDGSGGGMGAGGAIYVSKSSDVTITSVNITGSSAKGGAGGSAGTPTQGLGGGGMLGAGQASGVGGTNLASTGGGQSGASGAVGNGEWGAGGGGGGTQTQGGDGSFGGGGGGSVNSPGWGGAGGFGGGGGAVLTEGTGGLKGFAAGEGKIGAGGGGAGLGGAIFIENGGTISYGGNSNLSGNSAVGGASAGNAGLGGGSGLFLQGAGTLVLNAATGQTTTIADVISDQKGLYDDNKSSIAYQEYSDKYNVTVKGGGKAVLSGVNQYTGETSVTENSVLSVSTDRNLGTVTDDSKGTTGAKINLNNGTLLTSSGFSTDRGIALQASGTLNTAGTSNFKGIISGSGPLTVTGGGTANLSGNSSFSGGAIIDNATLGFNSDAQVGGKSLGNGSVTLRNNGKLTANSNVSLYRNVIVEATGGTINSNGNTLNINAPITGDGQLAIENGGATGKTTLNNAATNLGGVKINNGTLVLVDSTGLPGGSISGAIVNNGVLDIAKSSALTLSQPISGTGAVVQSGTGTTTLSGVNSYSGGTSVNNGALAVSNDAALGAASGGVIINGGALNLGDGFDSNRAIALNATNSNINAAGKVVLGGVLSGGGGLALNGAGTVNLTNNNVYSGGTMVNTGQLNLGNGGTTGSVLGDIVVAAGATVGVNRFDDYNLANNLSGAGNLAQNGTGTLTLSGLNNGLTGDLLFNNGKIAASNATQLGAGKLIFSGGTLLANGNLTTAQAVVLNPPSGGTIDSNGNNVALTGIVSGDGVLTKTGAGDLALSGDNSYKGGTVVKNGALTLTGNGTLGTGTATLAETGTLNINRTGTIANVIAGAGKVAVNSGGTTVLTGDSAGFTGTTKIDIGSNLSLGNGGNSGVIGGAITNNGTLTVNRANDVVLQGAIDGSGSLVKQGVGKLNLAADNSYSGDTIIQNGTLNLGNGGTTGSVVGNIAVSAGATLGVNRSDAVTLTNNISGAGNLAQNGIGVLTLTGNNAALSGDILFNNGTIAASNSAQLGTGNLVMSGGSLLANGDLTTNQNVILNAPGGGTINANGKAVTLGGVISGDGALNANNGNVVLTNDNTYRGGTTVNNGSLQLGNNTTTGSVLGAINLNNANLVVNHSNPFTLANMVTGTGNLNIQGTAPVTATGTNSFTGAVNVGSGSSLAISNASALGNANNSLNLTNGTLIANGNLALSNPVNLVGSGTLNNNGNIIASSGVISGGTLNLIGNGTTAVTGANIYSGGTNVTGGVLELGTGGTLGTGGLLLNAGSNLNLNSTTPVTLANPITGVGSMTQSGIGEATLTGANTYSGGTAINAGTLGVAGNGTFGTGAITVAPTGTLAIGTTTNPFVLSNPVSGTGVIAINNPTGTSVVGANNNFTGNTNLNGGTLTLGNGITAGTLGGNINTVAGTGLVLNPGAGGTTLGANITGAGTLAVSAPGTSVLTGTNTITGGTTIATGAGLTLGNGGTTGSLTGNIVNNGTLGINRSDPYILTGNVSGTGGVLISGTGAITLAGVTTYTGTTTVAGGSLVVNGNLTGPVVTTGTGTIQVNGTMSGGLTVNGTGTLATGGKLNGPLTIGTGGNYAVNGTVTGLVTVGVGGRLTGTGSLGAVNVGGTFAPGNSIGVASVVSGNLTFANTGVYEVELSPTHSDRVNVAGQALLNGASFVAIPAAGNYAVGTRYNVIDAKGGVIGTFSGMTTTGTYGDNIRPRLQHNSNNVELVLSAERLMPMTAGLSQNNIAMARVFDSAAGAASNRQGLTGVYDSSKATLGNALDQMSGQVSMGAGTTANRVGGSFLSTMMSSGLNAAGDNDALSGGLGRSGGASLIDAKPISSDFQGFGRQPAMANPYDEKVLVDARPYDDKGRTKDSARLRERGVDRLNTASLKRLAKPESEGWGQLMGGFGSKQGDASVGIHQIDTSFAGFAGGYTYRPEHNLTLGVSLAGVNSSFNAANGMGRGSADGMNLGLYGRYEYGRIYFAGSAGVGLYQFTTDRTVAMPGLNQSLKGNFTGQWMGGRAEIGRQFDLGRSFVSPFAALQMQQLNSNGYSEKDAAGAASGLTYQSRRHGSVRSELGVQVEAKRRMNADAWLTVRGMVAWAHEFAPSQNMAASLTQLPAASFVIQGVKTNAETLLISMAADVQMKKNWSYNARLSGEFSDRSAQLIGQVGAKYRW